MEFRVGLRVAAELRQGAGKEVRARSSISAASALATPPPRSMRPDPRFVQIVPDGAGPFGDPYQVDSANNGPYGEALTKEVIPYIEKTYRCIGTPKSRFTTGASTGGWVSFALQVFYPDFFNGCWSQCPDSVTFERFELADIYSEPNIYLNRFGNDRPGTRTIRRRHDLFRSGTSANWSACSAAAAGGISAAATGPAGTRPTARRARTGCRCRFGTARPARSTSRSLDHWKKYDLKLVLRAELEGTRAEAGGREGQRLGGRRGRLLPERGRPPAEGRGRGVPRTPSSTARILVEMRKGHSSGGWTRKEILDAMAERARVEVAAARRSNQTERS